ncbi:MAG: tetratricopeptide repeat protein [Saccharospirillaceae bacterium]|nr:tetratricopeptide repeat protein [Saccharospirillaceae bacterium]
MMNTKIYKTVHELAEKLMVAANKDDERAFGLFYEQLNKICVDNANTKKDHPVQWETLADFTDELEDAVVIYEKALLMAIDIDSHDFIASIGYSMATLQLELKLESEAIKNLEIAKISSNEIEDKELKAQIHDLLYPLTHG